MRKTVARFALLVAVVAPALALSHEGHEHKVMGTIKAVDGTHVEVQNQDGKTVTVRLDKETKYLRGTTPTSRADIKAGDRAVVIAVEEKESMKAKEVRLVPAGQPAASAAASGSKADTSSGVGTNDVLAAYEAVSRPLVSDDLAAAQKAATQLAERARSAGFNEIAHHAAELASSDSLESARKHFKAISADAIELAEAGEGYYVMTCPMVKADWVQSSKEVANPYLGQKMVRCGTIKQAHEH